MRIKIYLNRTYKHTCNLISYDVNVINFRIMKTKENKNTFIIDNIEYVDNKDLINSIEFIAGGYNNSIEFNISHIKGTDIEYPEDSKKNKCFTQVIGELKNLESEE